jgi:hypothetical protein
MTRRAGAGLTILAGFVAAVWAAPGVAASFQASYIAGSLDPAGRFAGGTEMRLLVAHGGRLYAGNGYWEDRPGSEGVQGAQILVLDTPGGRWRVDHSFDERMANGRPRDLAMGALFEANFTTDARGAALPRPVSLLIASSWDLTGATRVFTRDDATSAWTATTLAQERPDPNFLPQIRSFGQHRDRVTGADLVFAGQDPRGIFGGTYDPAVAGRIRWGAAPELDLSRVPTEGISGRNGYLRVTSFAEANGRLCVTVGQHVYERVDGAAPEWRLVYTNPSPGHSETGLRGLTAVPGPGGDVLLAAVEGNASRVVRIDPRDGSEATELDIGDFLGRSWGMRVNYTITAYNNMAKIGGSLLMGVMAFVPRNVPVAAGHALVDVGYGQVEAGGWYLVRSPGGRYDLHRIAADFGHPLVAVRAIAPSPFANDAAIYFGGYAANKAPAHNTAWIARADLAAALGGAP